ncbi:MAG: PAS domain S-box protein [Proteobacteria bacterium]|nr:PAS domain S-box protein [Pseudomonadota bacterium]MBU1714133.1 PAS domain S-box protein [Pseudomonadota bacterium]
MPPKLELPIYYNSKKLAIISLVTLAVVTFAFIAILQTFRDMRGFVDEEVKSNIQTIINGSKLRESLIRLELEIRDLLLKNLRNVELLAIERQRLLKSFDLVLDQDNNQESAGTNLLLQDRLNDYRKELDNLLQKYISTNKIILALDATGRHFTDQLTIMVEETGNMMIDYALSGQDTRGLEQIYILLPLCQEQVLKNKIMIETVVANKNIGLLGINTPHAIPVDKMTVTTNIAVLENTLRTLTSADSRISSRALEILTQIPIYNRQVTEFGVALSSQLTVQEKFESRRESILAVLAEIDENTNNSIRSIQEEIHNRLQNGILSTTIFAVIVILVSIMGWIMVRNISGRIELSAKEALKAKEETEEINIKLQNEIIDRQKIESALQNSYDNLELRVQERTQELSKLNVVLQTEIKERVEAEQSLATEKERLSVTLRSIGDGVITTDIDTRITLINKVAEKLTGWTHKDAVGRPLGEVFQIVNIDTEQPCDNPATKVITSGKVIELTDYTVLIGKDGTRRQIADSGAPIRDENNRIIGAALVFRDETEKYKIAEELLKIKKIESVGVLAGGIAHDFNNLLTSVFGYIDLSQMNVDPGSQVYKWLTKASKSCEHAKHLTGQLLTFSKGGEPVKSVTSIADLLKDAVYFSLSGSKISTAFKLNEDLKPTVIDKGQINQVIHNLMLNCKEAMPDGGEVLIKAENSMIEDKSDIPLAPGKYLKIEIRDNGPGIDENIIPMIFDPYFTTKNMGTKKGTGLGLAIAHSIISKHKGFIGVESKKGKGTTFKIYLPSCAGEIEQTDNHAEDAMTSRSGSIPARVLLLEDEEKVSRVAIDMLESLNCDVEATQTGQEAITQFNQAREDGKPFDLLIFDLTIRGGMGGEKTLKKILEIDPQVKAVVASGYADDPILANCREHGFKVAMTKPYSLQVLRSVLEELV